MDLSERIVFVYIPPHQSFRIKYSLDKARLHKDLFTKNYQYIRLIYIINTQQQIVTCDLTSPVF